MAFKFDFGDPLAVSTNNAKPDKMKLALKKNTFFSATPPYKPLTGNLDIELPVPKQFPNPTESAKTESVASGVKNLMLINIIIAIACQIAFS